MRCKVENKQYIIKFLSIHRSLCVSSVCADAMLRLFEQSERLTKNKNTIYICGKCSFMFHLFVQLTQAGEDPVRTYFELNLENDLNAQLCTFNFGEAKS